jgi:glycosyltransferase involved in cell wall biosynthesis
MSEMTVSIVIPNYNGEELLAKNLPLVLEAKKEKKNKILEIIVVDDASTDKSVYLIKKYFPQVRLIRHKVNRGFAASVNMGVRNAKGKLTALLNTDVKPEKNFLSPVFKHFKGNDVFAVSFHEKGFGWAKGVFEDGFIIHAKGTEVEEVLFLEGITGLIWGVSTKSFLNFIGKT